MTGLYFLAAALLVAADQIIKYLTRTYLMGQGVVTVIPGFLGLEYVDIFYHHRMDPETPLEETMEALASIVRSGKALYAGISNYDGPTMLKAAEILKDMGCPFIINQNRYFVIRNNNFCNNNAIHIFACVI